MDQEYAHELRRASQDEAVRLSFEKHGQSALQPNANLLQVNAQTTPPTALGGRSESTEAPAPVPLVDVSPAAHPADAINTPNFSPPGQPVDWEFMRGLGLYTERPSTPVESAGHLSPMSDMVSALPSAASIHDGGVPMYNSSSLRASQSIRSQRNWNEFDGRSVTPLPSPMFRPLDPEESPRASPRPETPSSPTPALSKTQAFFSPSAHPPPPKPPANRNISRSASSRVPSTSSESQRRRQRALSSPQQPARPEPMESLAPPSASDLLAPPPALPQPERLFPALPIERKASRPTSRHFYGPSMSVTNDSIVPARSPPPSHAPEPAPETTAADTSTEGEGTVLRDNDPLLQSVDQPNEEEDEQEGRVGPYRVLSRLGTGAFSKVLLAEPRDPGARRGRVALKMIACEPWQVDKRMRVSWIREAEVLRHISHPNIVRFVNSFRTPRHYTLVLDAVDGGELFDLLAHHQAEIARREWLVRRIFGELASAVGWMHENHLVHRDIKLENIMMTRTLFAPGAPPLRPSTLGAIPLVKVTDFGLARFIHPDQLLETRCGSEEYAAPELIMGKKYNGQKTDAWALGVVLYALLTGGLPFVEAGAPPVAVDAQEQPARERHIGNTTQGEREAKTRKMHLLRIAKGELEWPQRANDHASSAESPDYEKALRLVTPQACHITQRFLRRDVSRRAHCWDLWQDPWFLYGSFVPSPGAAQAPISDDDALMLCTAAEESAAGERVPLPYSPRDARGQAWIHAYTATRDESAPCHRD